MPESRGSYVARMVAGVLLVLESALLLVIAMFTAIVGGFMGLLAFGVEGGSATDAQIAQGFAMIAFTIVSPFVVAALLLLGGVLLLFRRAKSVVIVSAVVAIAAQAAFHVHVEKGFSVAGAVPLALHLGTIVIAIASVPHGGAR